MRNYMIFLLTLLILPCFMGCEDHSSSTSVPVDRGAFSVGQTVYNSVENYVALSNNGLQKVQILQGVCNLCQQESGQHRHDPALDGTHRERIITGVNNVFATRDTTLSANASNDDTRSLQDLARTMYDLIDDGILPQLTDSMGSFVNDVAADRVTVQALTDFVNTRTGTNLQNLAELARRMLTYPKTPEVCRAVARLVLQNPDFMKNIFRLVSESMSCLPESGPEADAMAQLLEILTLEPPIEADHVLGTPAWVARLDANNNPRVLGFGAEMFKPFVDQNNDGVCDVNEAGLPVDADGHTLEIAAFSSKEYKGQDGHTVVWRDSVGRAVDDKGVLIFEYYNAKKTILGLLLYNMGEALQRGLPKDLLLFGRVALLPKKNFSDILGPYEGYSDESNGLKAALGAMDLLKREQTRHLLRGFAALITENPSGAETFLIGLGKLVCMLRDEELQAPEQIAVRIMQIIQSGSIPEILLGLQAMEQIQVPESGMPNMAILFMYWLSGNIEEISAQTLWPLRSAMLAVKAAYPQDPALVERLWYNLVKLGCGSFSAERKMSPILPVFLRLLVIGLAENTDAKVEQMKTSFKSLVTSRFFALFMRHIEFVMTSPEAKALGDSLLYALTPQANGDNEVFGELARVTAGVLQYKQDIKIRVRFFKIIAKFLHPDRPIVTKMIEALNRLIIADNQLAFLQGVRMAVTKCHKYCQAPVFMFGHAAVAVMRIDCHFAGHGNITIADTYKALHGTSGVLLDYDGLLQRLYRVIRNRAK